MIGGDPNVYYQQLLAGAMRRGEWSALGAWLHEQKRWGAAAGCYARAVTGAPGDHVALAGLGWNLHMAGRSDEAVDWLQKAIAAAPGEGTPYALLSQVWASLGNGQAALTVARRAVELDEGPAINHVALAFSLMALGQWKEGWEVYEHRFAFKIPEFRTRPFRLWRGERVGTLFIEAEQGLGDAIMALRWVPAAAGRADRVVLYVHREVYPLVSAMRGLPPNVTAYPLPRVLPEADAWIPMMSLPVALEIDAPGEDERPYLDVGVTREEGPFRVGLVWAGSPAHEQAHHRDSHLAYWLRLTELPVELHSLQLGEAAGQLNDLAVHALIHDRAPEMTNFLDTARVMAGLDLVISVDTAAAHLAGALGVPCWLLLNCRGGDFRWGHEGQATPWYQGHTIVRRGYKEDWPSVMKRVDALLVREVEGK